MHAGEFRVVTGLLTRKYTECIPPQTLNNPLDLSFYHQEMIDRHECGLIEECFGQAGLKSMSRKVQNPENDKEKQQILSWNAWH